MDSLQNNCITRTQEQADEENSLCEKTRLQSAGYLMCISRCQISGRFLSFLFLIATTPHRNHFQRLSQFSCSLGSNTLCHYNNGQTISAYNRVISFSQMSKCRIIFFLFYLINRRSNNLNSSGNFIMQNSSIRINKRYAFYFLLQQGGQASQTCGCHEIFSFIFLSLIMGYRFPLNRPLSLTFYSLE